MFYVAFYCELEDSTSITRDLITSILIIYLLYTILSSISFRLIPLSNYDIWLGKWEWNLEMLSKRYNIQKIMISCPLMCKRIFAYMQKIDDWRYLGNISLIMENLRHVWHVLGFLKPFAAFLFGFGSFLSTTFIICWWVKCNE